MAGDTTQLFDMQTDPKERSNRADEPPKRVQEMRAQIKAFANSLDTPLADQEE